MPELPEVETTKRGIEPHLVGKKFIGSKLRRLKLRIKFNKKELEQILNKKIVSVTRRAKYILINFSNNSTLLIHLGMTGTLRISNSNKYLKHVHLIFHLTNKKSLIFNDARRFGLAQIILKGEKFNMLENNGPDPFELNKDWKYLYMKMCKSEASIKSILLNSKIVSGIGNIYACETLFESNISPLRPGKKITEEDASNLLKNSKKILKKAIKAGGTTLKDYLSADARPGYFKIKLKVYDREGQECKKCSNSIIRIVQNNRSSFYCPSCQQS